MLLTVGMLPGVHPKARLESISLSKNSSPQQLAAYNGTQTLTLIKCSERWASFYKCTSNTNTVTTIDFFFN